MRYILLWSILFSGAASANSFSSFNGLAEMYLMVFLVLPILCIQSLACIILALMHKFISKKTVRTANIISFSTLLLGLITLLAYVIERSVNIEAISLLVITFFCGIIAWTLPNIQYNHFKQQ